MPQNAEKDMPANFREAFCLHFGCQPREFERRVFWKALNPGAKFLVFLFGGFDREAFAKDIEALRALGKAVTRDDLDGVLQEFGGVNAVERSIRRRVLKMRVSGAQMSRLFELLEPLIHRTSGPESAGRPVSTPSGSGVDVSITAPGTIHAVARAEPAPVADPRGILPAQAEMIHAAITRGEPLGRCLAAAGLTRKALMDGLDAAAKDRPHIAWLKSWIVEQQELENLRLENDRLRRLIEELTSRLSGRG